ncbi:thiaminase II [Aliiglaciecola lipolytica]|uniref:Aminopyrimidine aminohydrolase n=1 Tax=Aliiglaciecola lipolytica E3 TaxID=1127673 RepID=K6X7E4_9ALTE|nr:thiaminase II [Aliiglaciecola lipolytica]GAC16539.1 thiaminase [Aliiglaciecola lipolytica E3]
MTKEIPNYGKTFALLRAGCEVQWEEYIEHDFVKSLGNGTLPQASFLHYMVQDYVYLVHYARAWALGVVKAESIEEMRLCAATVDSLINKEFSLHIQTCAAQGIEESSLYTATEELETIAYTRYVLDAGLQGDFLDLLLALAPCAFGYGEIGLRLKDNVYSGHPYEKWIKTYSGDDFQNVCIKVGKLLDLAIASRVGDTPQNSPRWHKMQARFTKAAELEANFWGMGLRAGKQ